MELAPSKFNDEQLAEEFTKFSLLMEDVSLFILEIYALNEKDVRSVSRTLAILVRRAKFDYINPMGNSDSAGNLKLLFTRIDVSGWKKALLKYSSTDVSSIMVLNIN